MCLPGVLELLLSMLVWHSNVSNWERLLFQWVLQDNSFGSSTCNVFGLNSIHCAILHAQIRCGLFFEQQQLRQMTILSGRRWKLLDTEEWAKQKHREICSEFTLSCCWFYKGYQIWLWYCRLYIHFHHEPKTSFFNLESLMVLNTETYLFSYNCTFNYEKQSKTEHPYVETKKKWLESNLDLDHSNMLNNDKWHSSCKLRHSHFLIHHTITT